MSYCQVHSCNNCIECALEKQTAEIVKAIRDSSCAKKEPVKKTFAEIMKQWWC